MKQKFWIETRNANPTIFKRIFGVLIKIVENLKNGFDKNNNKNNSKRNNNKKEEQLVFKMPLLDDIPLDSTRLEYMYYIRLVNFCKKKSEATCHKICPIKSTEIVQSLHT